MKNIHHVLCGKCHMVVNVKTKQKGTVRAHRAVFKLSFVQNVPQGG